MVRKRKTSKSLSSVLARALVPIVFLAAWLFCGAVAQAQSGAIVSGTVKDSSGGPIAGAKVSFQGGGATLDKATDPEGRFSFSGVQAQSGRVIVQADGFTTQTQSWSSSQPSAAPIEFVLSPASLMERVTVTATRTQARLSDTAADVDVLTPSELASTSAPSLDGALRQVPGFSLFRRSDSTTANPTTQGVSLRGVGENGASRALVLSDGIPLNDPFGGWVYWDRIPREAVDSVEVVRGGSSDLYGSDATGGVINIITRKPESSTLSFESSYGNEETPEASLSSSFRDGRWIGILDGEAFHTDGYIPVDPADQGSIDSPAGSTHTVADLTIERLVSENARVFARGTIFGESRSNGTILEKNRTHLRQLALGGDWQFDSLGAISLRAYGGPQVYDQNFGAISLDRNSETLTRVQRVPAQQLGFSAQWTGAAGARQTLVGGFDAQGVRGSSDELGFTGGRLMSASGAGGRERTFSFFGEDIFRLTSRWIFTLGTRYDTWLNYRALSTTRPLAPTGPAKVIDFPDRDEQAFSPRLSILHKNDNISINVSGYRAFRAPTLNELYRSFRVGNVLTLANDTLVAERLTGGEGGATWTALGERLVARGAFFWSDIVRPVSNVTLSATPSLITRERENLGRTRSQGVDLDLTARLRRGLEVSGGYEFADARVISFPVEPALVNLLIPQVPRHQATFQTTYQAPSRITLGLQGRAASSQFEDDQNQLILNRYFTMDAFLSRSFSRGLEVFVAAENVTGQRYQVGRTPVLTLGPPVLARVGIRVQVPHLR